MKAKTMRHWVRGIMGLMMAVLVAVPVKGLADSCGGSHEGSEPGQREDTFSANENAGIRDNLERSATENIPDNDPLEGPEWDTNHDMRGILYDQDGNEIRRLGRESRRHREDREARERREREERERRERERREREERERREREERERREQERRERQERERREREERERREREERERQERERRDAEERERQEREARNRRPLTQDEQLAGSTARPNTTRQRELERRQRVDDAMRDYEEESRRYRQGSESTGWSGSNHPAAQVGEEMAEVVGGGPIPAGAVNAAGEVNRLAPVVRSRNRVIEELSE